MQFFKNRRDCPEIPPIFTKESGLICGKDYDVSWKTVAWKLETDKTTSFFLKMRTPWQVWKKTLVDSQDQPLGVTKNQDKFRGTALTQLEIPIGALVHVKSTYGQEDLGSQSAGSKLRSDKALVLQHEVWSQSYGIGRLNSDIALDKNTSLTSTRSSHTCSHPYECHDLYTVGKMFTPDAFSYVAEECRQGVHFFATKVRAQNYAVIVN